MTTIQDIIDNIYELEGLMREIDVRADDAPRDLYECARVKAEAILAQVSTLNTNVEPVTESEVLTTEDLASSSDTPEVLDEEIPSIPQPEVIEETIVTDPIEEQTIDVPVHDPLFDTPVNEVEMPARQINRPPLRSMFTINDLFKFRRELFGNSEADFNEVLSLVSGMSSYSEAEDYFYGYLCWPADSEPVTEFMGIINRYFN